MFQGLLELVKSRRFQLLVVAGVAWILQQDSITLDVVLKAVSVVLVGAVGVGSLDKFGEKVSGK